MTPERKIRTPRPPRRKRSVDPGADELEAVIRQLKEIMARIVAESDGETEFELLVRFMEKYSLAGTRMAALLKSKREMADASEPGEALSEALQLALESFPGWNPDETAPR